MNKIFICLLVLIVFSYANESDSLIQDNNDDLWKISLFPQFNMASIGQLHNNKPLKALSLTAMKIHWLNEFKIAHEAMKISNRSRAFWWFMFLYFYTVIDASIDAKMESFPDDTSIDTELESFPDDEYKMKEGK